MNIQEVFEEYKQLTEARLKELLPDKEVYPGVIHEAMAYSLFAGGKRFRPTLCLAGCEAVGGKNEDCLDAACALECIHTYSLIHDDLPGMDDDDYRRGKLTNHKVFGEGMAILAGDALLTVAFELLANMSNGQNEQQLLQVIKEIAVASGTMGMVGGQVVDLQSENTEPTEELLQYIHTHKTGALITASVRVGGILGGATEEELEQLSIYGEKLGLAFQITDDILDVIGDEAKLGKPVGSDEKNHKATYPALFGLEQSKIMAQQAVEDAIRAIDCFGEKAIKLELLAQYLISRDV